MAEASDTSLHAPAQPDPVRLSVLRLVDQLKAHSAMCHAAVLAAEGMAGDTAAQDSFADGLVELLNQNATEARELSLELSDLADLPRGTERQAASIPAPDQAQDQHVEWLRACFAAKGVCNNLKAGEDGQNVAYEEYSRLCDLIETTPARTIEGVAARLALVADSSRTAHREEDVILNIVVNAVALLRIETWSYK